MIEASPLQSVPALDPTSSIMLNGWYLDPVRRVTTFAVYIMKYFHKAVTLL